MCAKPIEATPTLYGKEADRFLKKMALTSARKKITEADRETLRKMMFTDEYLTVGDKKFQIPRCHTCGKGMKPQVDRIAKKVTGYLWQCPCMKGFMMSVG